MSPSLPTGEVCFSSASTLHFGESAPPFLRDLQNRPAPSLFNEIHRIGPLPPLLRDLQNWPVRVVPLNGVGSSHLPARRALEWRGFLAFARPAVSLNGVGSSHLLARRALEWCGFLTFARPPCPRMAWIPCPFDIRLS